MYNKLQQSQLKDFRKIPDIQGLSDNTYKFNGAYKGSINSYLLICTPKQQTIAKVFLKYRRFEWIKLTNSLVAKEARCAIKTVTRATNQFHLDGFIIKDQITPYSPNSYTINPKMNKGDSSYQYHVTHEKPRNKNIIKKSVSLHTENVPLSKILTLKRSYIYNKPHNLTPYHGSLTHESARGVFCDQKSGGKIVGMTKKKYEELFKKGFYLMKPEQRTWIINNRKTPQAKEVLNRPDVKAMLITPLVESVTKMLDLNEREQLKVSAFPAPALQGAFDFAKQLVDNPRRLASPVKDKMGWFLGICQTFCKQMGCRADWQLYFAACDILDIKPIEKDEQPRPLKVSQAPQKTKSKHSGYSPYDPWVAPKELTITERMEHLQFTIDHCRKVLEEPSKYMNGLVFDAALEIIKTIMKQSVAELLLLEEEYVEVN